MACRRRFPLLLVLVLVALAASAAAAEKVTLYRDVWGVPHIYADTELGAAYAYGYAQAQDRLEQILRNYRQAEGTLAEVDGPSALMGDFISRVVGHAEVCRAQYPQMPAQARAYIEAYQAGIKRYMQEHPSEVPAWAPELHPAQATAVLRAVIFNWPLGEAMSDLGRAGIALPQLSSNQWSISPARTADKCAMLFIDPHIPWAGMFRFHEARVHGGDLHMSGFCPVGTPFVGLGHNSYVGWACTTGGPDTSDIFAETLDPANPMRYKVDDQWREFQVKQLQIKVKQGDSVKTITQQLLISRHGPIIAQKEGKAYALAIPYLDQAGQSEMIYRLDRAKSTDEVKEICASNQWMAQNFMYAGTDGHIRYIRVGRVPIRPAGVDWRQPIPGEVSANDWQGIHPQSDLVQVDDPPDGYMQNCNITPTIMCRNQPVDPSKYRPYIFNADTGRPWHSRGTRAVDLLDADSSVTLEEALAIANDTHVLGWEKVQPVLADAAKAAQAEITSLDATDIVDALLKWDGNMETDSVGAALFFAWWQAMPKACPGIDRTALLQGKVETTPAQRRQILEALRPAVMGLIDTHGSWRVPWGEINRVGRGDRTFPLAGCATNGLVTLRAVGGDADAKSGKIVCGSGQSCTTLVLFKPGRVESYSVTPWGESDNPTSPHYLDQAEKLFGRKLLKSTWFQREDLLAGNNVESTMTLDYLPGK